MDDVTQESQCTYRCVVPPDMKGKLFVLFIMVSQCTYRCVVLPDDEERGSEMRYRDVSMHLQVRGAP